MYCSRCGLAIGDSVAVCPNCGHPAGEQIQQQALKSLEQRRYEGGIRRLSTFWFLFAALNGVLGLTGMILAQTGVTSAWVPWEPWPHPPGWGWTLAGSMVWVVLVTRMVLSVVAGWGLQDRAEWARPVAIIASATAFTQFPIGVVLGAYTMAFFMSRSHASLPMHSA